MICSTIVVQYHESKAKILETVSGTIPKQGILAIDISLLYLYYLNIE